VTANLWQQVWDTHYQEEVSMARVKIEEIIDHLNSDIRRALEETVKTVVPDVNFDAHQLFREFTRNIGRICNTWETVPDQYIEQS
jgi:hypothetical protein